MDLRFSLFGVLLCCYGVFCQEVLETHFMGKPLYEVNSNAHFTCQFSPLPADLSTIEVSWYVGERAATKIAKSYQNSTNSFVYNTASDELKARFEVSSDRFADGIAEATISNIQIGDENYYTCDVDYNQQQDRDEFKVEVFKQPLIRIKNINTELDIRDNRPVYDEASEENFISINDSDIILDSESSTDYGPRFETETPTVGAGEGNSTSTETVGGTGETEGAETETGENEGETAAPTEEGSAEMYDEVEDDEKVTIVHCLVDNVYPLPSKIVFNHQAMNDDELEWEIAPENYFSVRENSDDTFNVTARLRIEPMAKLDKQKIICSSYITADNIRTVSEPSEEIAVKYTTSKVSINFDPSDAVDENDEVRISCRANGNPNPTVLLTKHDRSTVDLTDTNEPYRFTATRDNAGFYECTASNSEDNLVTTEKEELLVHWLDAPTITGPEDIDDVRLGNSVELDCYANSNSRVSYQWYKDGQRLQNKNSKTLKFETLEASDSGLYKCETSTGRHVKSADYSLTVRHGCMPKLEYHVSASTEEPGNAYLSVTCTAAGNPPCKMKLSSFGDHEAAVSDNQAQLEITSLEKQTTSLVFDCAAMNEISSNTVSINITDSQVVDVEPQTDGASTGVVIIIVVVAVLTVIGIFVACYVIRNRKSKQATLSQQEKTLDDVEADKLTAPTEEEKY